MYRHSMFGNFARWASRAAGHPATFTAAVLLILIWLITGPIFGYTDTWQLVMYTSTTTTIITFLMVFLIQNTENRDGAAVQLKLNELIRATNGAHNRLLDLEELAVEELEGLRASYATVAHKAREELKRGQNDTGSVDLEDLSDEELDSIRTQLDRIRAHYEALADKKSHRRAQAPSKGTTSGTTSETGGTYGVGGL